MGKTNETHYWFAITETIARNMLRQTTLAANFVYNPSPPRAGSRVGAVRFRSDTRVANQYQLNPLATLALRRWEPACDTYTAYF